MRSKGTSEVKSSSSMAVTQGHRHKATKLSEVRDFQEPLVVLSERPSGINYIKSAIFLTFFFFSFHHLAFSPVLRFFPLKPPSAQHKPVTQRSPSIHSASLQT